MSKRCYIGIDPGKSGGVAWLVGDEVCYEVMPSTERDIWDLIGWKLDGMYARFTALIELVHSMPGQGISSVFKFGVGYGGLRMCLVAADIPFEEVTPYVWQKALGIQKRKKTESKADFKNRLRAKAQQLYPKLEIWNEPKSKGRQLAVCDAILIATYCKRKFEGSL